MGGKAGGKTGSKREEWMNAKDVVWKNRVGSRKRMETVFFNTYLKTERKITKMIQELRNLPHEDRLKH